jgi:hypothetical protein
MEVKDLVYILFFILPGVLAKKVSYIFEIPDDKKRTEFGELVNGVLLSLPIDIITIYIIFTKHNYSKLWQCINDLNDFKFMIEVTYKLAIVTILVGLIIGLSKDKLIAIVNFIRIKLNRIEIDDKTCWRKMFLDKPESHYVEIIKDGKVYKGFTKWCSLSDEEKEIVLYKPEELRDYPDFESKFRYIKQTYINIEKNIVINDYDMKEYCEYCDNLKKLNES